MSCVKLLGRTYTTGIKATFCQTKLIALWLKRDMSNLSTLLDKYNLRPHKGLGQNFLTDPHHLAQIVAAAEINSTDTVLEIGPGPGTLTQLLTQVAGRVIAVEVDAGMVNLLQQEYGHLANLTIVQADILQTDLAMLLGEPPLVPPNQGESLLPLQMERAGVRFPYKVVANLPYYITSAVLRQLLEAQPQPQRLVVMVQKEVAQRMVAKPNDMSILAVSVQFYGQPTIVHHVPAGAFYPRPQVDSAVVRVDTFASSPLPGIEAAEFFRVVKAGFGQKRKQLKNSLAAGLKQPMTHIVAALQKADIDPTRRAETLTLAEWGRLVAPLRLG